MSDSLTEILAEQVLYEWANKAPDRTEWQRRSAIIDRARAALAKAGTEEM